MLKQMVEEELIVLNELIKDASAEYDAVFDSKGSGMVSAELFNWMHYLRERHKYLSAVLAKLNLTKG